MNKIICGDALATLQGLQSGIVQTCVTSPPYFGLRDYGTETILQLGDDPECKHEWIHEGRDEDGMKVAQCKLCNAVKYDQQIGLEDTPELYIARLVEVFREVKRVLRDDGTLWVNIGDSYASGGTGGKPSDKSTLYLYGRHGQSGRSPYLDSLGESKQRDIPDGLKPKDLIGIPWMLAFALRADGWYLRSDIIWHKPNCMPESVTDRPTKAHEYIFLLSKSERYFYDADAIRETAVDDEETFYKKLDKKPNRRDGIAGKDGRLTLGLRYATYNPLGRNKRSVWTVSTVAYSESHFATFPPKLIEPCILAGTSPRACEVCGSPWERVTEREGGMWELRKANGAPMRHGLNGNQETLGSSTVSTIGWEPTCNHDNTGSGKCVVLDPFCGAGTVPLVSIAHGRAYLGIELNPEYIALINKRIHTVQQNLWSLEDIAV